MPKNKKIEILACIIVFGFFGAVFWNYFCLYHYGYAGVAYFLFKPGDEFIDFYVMYDAVKSFDPYLSSHMGGVYFPFSYLIMAPFVIGKKNFSLFLYLTIFYSLFLFLNRSFLSKNNLSSECSKFQNIKNIFILSFLSYPALWMYDRANIEAIVFIFLGFFIYFYVKKSYVLSVVLLSMATAMKAYPSVFLLLFLSEKKYKEVFMFGVITILLSIVPLFLMKSHLVDSLIAFRQNLLWFDNYFTKTIRSLTFSTNLLAFFRIIFHRFQRLDYNYSEPLTGYQLSSYFYFSFAIFVCLAMYVWFYRTELWKKVMLLTCMMLLLPQVVFDYKLIHIYLPLYLFVNKENSIFSDKLDFLYILLFGLLLIPKNYISIAGESVSGLLNPMLMLFMIMLIISSPIIRKMKGRSLINVPAT